MQQCAGAFITGLPKPPWQRHCTRYHRQLMGHCKHQRLKAKPKWDYWSQTPKSKGKESRPGKWVTKGHSLFREGVLQALWMETAGWSSPHTSSFYMEPQMCWILYTVAHLYTAKVHKASCLTTWMWVGSLAAVLGALSVLHRILTPEP